MGDTAQETRVGERVRDIRKRADAATKGPWIVGEYGRVWTDCGKHVNRVVASLNPDLTAQENAELIANARQDIPWLLNHLATVERQRDVLLEAAKGMAAANRRSDVPTWISAADGLEAAIAQVEEAS